MSNLLKHLEKYPIHYILPQGNHNPFYYAEFDVVPIHYILPQGNHNLLKVTNKS